MSRAYLSLGSIFVAWVITALAAADEARFAKWAKVEFSFRGPAAQGRGEPNPFAVKLDVDFCAPGGRHYRVPGFNEEYNENYKLPQALEYLQHLADLDPYHHPRGIHNVNTPSDDYIAAPQIDFTSIQTGSPGGRDPGALLHNQRAIDWIDRCRSRGRRVLMVGFDEGRPEEDRRAWWSAYLGGGVWEAHVLSPYDRPMSAWERVWTELGGTRTFMESLPFWEMTPANEVVRAGKAFCLAKHGESYALYLPEGGEVEVQLPAGRDFVVTWWNPTQGRAGNFTHESRVRGDRQKLVAPMDGDWAARIVLVQQPQARRQP